MQSSANTGCEVPGRSSSLFLRLEGARCALPRTTIISADAALTASSWKDPSFENGVHSKLLLLRAGLSAVPYEL